MQLTVQTEMSDGYKSSGAVMILPTSRRLHRTLNRSSKCDTVSFDIITHLD